MKPPRTPLELTPESLGNHLDEISKAMSNISFGTTTSNTDAGRNISGYMVTVTSPVAPNTEFSVAHNLNRIPIGFIVISAGAGGTVYKGSTAWTSTTVYLKETAGNNPLVLFIV